MSQIQITLEGEEAESEKDCVFYQDGMCIFPYQKHHKCPSLKHCNHAFVSRNLTDEEKEYWGITKNNGENVNVNE